MGFLVQLFSPFEKKKPITFQKKIIINSFHQHPPPLFFIYLKKKGMFKTTPLFLKTLSAK